MTLSPIVALAQTSPTATPERTVTTSTDREEHHDYGLLGLLGLVGLAGLIRRKPDVYTHDTAAGRTDVRR
jgi:MYXO-CTERM domain-containing protein